MLIQRCTLAVILTAFFAHPLVAQCSSGWVYGDSERLPPVGMPMLWDPDAEGPIAPQVLWIGSFNLPGKSVVYNQRAAIYAADGTMQVLGDEAFVEGATGGATGSVLTSRAAIHNGELYICGSILSIGGRPINNVARWDGTRWQPVGNGLYFINGASTTANNIFSAGGSLYLFTKTNTGATYRFARWDGSTWTIDPFPAANGSISQTVQGPDGLYFLGDFTSIGGVAATRIARFDGTTFHPVGPLSPGFMGPPTITFDNGVLYATALSAMSGGDRGVYKLEGGNWVGIAGSPQRLRGLTAFDGSIYGAEFLGGFDTERKWWRWNGASWSVNATLDPTKTTAPFAEPITTLVHDGKMYFGTNTVAGWDAPLAGCWDGVTWRAVSGGVGSGTISPIIRSLQPWRGGLYVGGSRPGITQSGSVLSTLSKWTEDGWEAVSMPVPVDHVVLSMGVWKNELLLGHAPLSTTQLSAFVPATSGLLRWDGSSFRPMTAGAFTINSVAPFGPFAEHNGRLYTKDPVFSYWNESSWTKVVPEDRFSCMAEFRGSLVIGGDFTDLDLGRVSANRVAMHDGATWRPLGGGLNHTVNGFTTYQGQLIALGRFTQADGQPANGIARWNGSRWEGIPTTGIGPLTTGTFQFTAGIEYNGELYVTCPGTFNGTEPVARVLRWDGAQWSLLSGDAPSFTPSMFAVHNGELFMAGVKRDGAGYPSGWGRWRRDGQPTISTPPVDAVAQAGSPASMTVGSSGGTQFRWQREVAGNFTDLVNGPLPSGAVVSGATTDGLTISGVQMQDAGRYRVLVSSPCGTVASFPARFTINP